METSGRVIDRFGQSNVVGLMNGVPFVNGTMASNVGGNMVEDPGAEMRSLISDIDSAGQHLSTSLHLIEQAVWRLIGVPEKQDGAKEGVKPEQLSEPHISALRRRAEKLRGQAERAARIADALRPII
jgi:hypothetical protein